MSLTDKILTRARELGFTRAGIAPATPLPHGDAYRKWIDTGMNGVMHYMERTRDTRDKPQSILSEAQSVIVLATNYRNEPPPAELGRYAGYARGYDYHKVLDFRLKQLAAFIKMETGQDTRSRSSVDRLPVLERDLAYLAGIGWYGKNTMIMNRTEGSHLFLAELFVDLDLETSTPHHESFCGTCTACLDACPTRAFVSPYVLDARKCISYLTIELKGPIPRDLRPLIGDHLFGCDICQTVCPWNRKAPQTEQFAFMGRPEIGGLTAPEILRMDKAEFQRHLALSPIQRAHRPGLARNAAVVLGNSLDRRWISNLDLSLATDRSPLVRGHVVWAIGRIGGPRAVGILERHKRLEDDPYVLEEIQAALADLHRHSETEP